jgi:hypothetical protein
VSDRLCREYSLSVVTPGQDKGKSYAEYTADHEGGGSWKSKLKAVIDTLIPHSKDFEDFLKRLEAAGYEIKRDKYTRAVPTLPDAPVTAKPFKRDITKSADKPVNLIVDIENSVKAQQSAGLALWQKIQNLKEAAKTLNFLTENNLLQYSDLATKEREAAAALDTAADSLKAAETRLADMAGLIKNITAYQQTKPVYDGMRTAKDKTAYRRTHHSAIALHETAANTLKGTGALKTAFPSGKLPNLAPLQTEYATLTEKKNALRAEYAALKKSAREYGVVRRNVDSILNPAEPKAKRRERGAEL